MAEDAVGVIPGECTARVAAELNTWTEVELRRTFDRRGLYRLVEAAMAYVCEWVPLPANLPYAAGPIRSMPEGPTPQGAAALEQTARFAGWLRAIRDQKLAALAAFLRATVSSKGMGSDATLVDPWRLAEAWPVPGELNWYLTALRGRALTLLHPFGFASLSWCEMAEAAVLGRHSHRRTDEAVRKVVESRLRGALAEHFPDLNLEGKSASIVAQGIRRVVGFENKGAPAAVRAFLVAEINGGRASSLGEAFDNAIEHLEETVAQSANKPTDTRRCTVYSDIREATRFGKATVAPGWISGRYGAQEIYVLTSVSGHRYFVARSSENDDRRARLAALRKARAAEKQWLVRARDLQRRLDELGCPAGVWPIITWGQATGDSRNLQISCADGTTDYLRSLGFRGAREFVSAIYLVPALENEYLGAYAKKILKRAVRQLCQQLEYTATERLAA